LLIRKERMSMTDDNLLKREMTFLYMYKRCHPNDQHVDRFLTEATCAIRSMDEQSAREVTDHIHQEVCQLAECVSESYDEWRPLQHQARRILNENWLAQTVAAFKNGALTSRDIKERIDILHRNDGNMPAAYRAAAVETLNGLLSGDMPQQVPVMNDNDPSTGWGRALTGRLFPGRNKFTYQRSGQLPTPQQLPTPTRLGHPQEAQPLKDTLTRSCLLIKKRS